ncbi:hypothetical protein H9Q09_06235 [Aurantimonas sp. DM33-3]|uniref:hypothetical protein n=1 Tax=Aurantimonas sp. DM33-3 TaxID=2766955 RepID=UPI00165280C1|nr:hypothetical protein [Aurantimonas sp. DM33-3]MBC6715792.1 hypothetical protein [Aurantimonas sp. DM33-3]
MSDIRRERTMASASAQALPRISWGAIVAGSLLAMALQFMLGLLGLGIGLSSIEAAAAGDAGALLSAGGLWTIAVVLIGLFVGAYAAGRLSGSVSRTDAVLHGVITWATSTLVVVFLLTSGASAVVGGAFGAIGSSIQGLTQAAATAAPQSDSGLPDPIRREVAQLLDRASAAPAPQPTADAAGPDGEDGVAGDGEANDASSAAQAGSADLAGAVTTIAAGLAEDATSDERTAAVQAIADGAGIPTAQARQRLQAFQQRFDEAQRDARRAAAEAAQVVSSASFGAFVALLLGLLVGAAGGFVGRSRRPVM